MALVIPKQSTGDSAATEVFASAAFPSSATDSGWVEVRGYRQVDFLFIISSQQNVTDLTVFVDHSDDGSRAFPVVVESLDTTATPAQVDQYAYKIVAADAFSGTQLHYAVTVPVRGKYMRVSFFGGPSVGTDTVQVLAYRRS